MKLLCTLLEELESNETLLNCRALSAIQGMKFHREITLVLMKSKTDVMEWRKEKEVKELNL